MMSTLYSQLINGNFLHANALKGINENDGILEDAASVILQYGHHTNHGAGCSQYYVAILVANVYGTTFRCLFPYT